MPLFGWWHAADTKARRAFVAAALGWGLDAFDFMLWALVVATLIPVFEMSKTTAGLMGSIALLGAAAGGLLFGLIADRYGRTRALMGSILIYSVATAACGLAQSLAQLAVFRVCLGIGMGGEWGSGAALVSENFPAEHRGKALGFVQSSWAIGYGAAAIVTWLVLPRWGWRAVFFVGVLPAFLTLWISRRVEEPDIWRTRATAGDSRTGPQGGTPTVRFADIFSGELGRLTLAVTLMNACTLFGWWGLNIWIPPYLSLPPSQGGVGLTTAIVSGLVVVMEVGRWFGYVSFGYMADAFGRKRAYVGYLLVAAILIPLYGVLQAPLLLLVLGPFVAFFGTGYFSGFGALTAEIYPTTIRATAQGFTYNIGRVASAAAPFAVGSLAGTNGFGVAFAVTGVAFLCAALAWIWIPETRGAALR
jgi:MFS family permease